MRIEQKEAFSFIGQKIWITGQNVEQFDTFWTEAHHNGLVERLKALAPASGVTGSQIFGVSRVDKDPENRAFYFYIATECDAAEGLEGGTIPACLWAIFSGEGDMPLALVNAEIYAFSVWLPASGYRHAHAPELEVYPVSGGVEFWLPIEKNA